MDSIAVNSKFTHAPQEVHAHLACYGTMHSQPFATDVLYFSQFHAYGLESNRQTHEHQDGSLRWQDWQLLWQLQQQHVQHKTVAVLQQSPFFAQQQNHQHVEQNKLIVGTRESSASACRRVTRCSGSRPPRSRPAKDRKPLRVLRNMFLKTRICKYFVSGNCIKGSNCMFAHGEEDQQPKPDLCCTKVCPLLVETGTCSNEICTYAHHVADLRQKKTSKPQRDAGFQRIKESLSSCEGYDDGLIVKNSFLHWVSPDQARRRSHSAPGFKSRSLLS